MDFINVDSSASHKISGIINSRLGGSLGLIETFNLRGKGISGLYYASGIKGWEQKENSNTHVAIERFKEGVGFYLRNIRDNYVVLISSAEVQKIEIIKETDLILPKKRSLFKSFLKWRFPYHIAKIFVLEAEEVEMHSPKILFYLNNGQALEFSISRINPYPVYDFIERHFQGFVIEKDIKDFLLLGRQDT